MLEVIFDNVSVEGRIVDPYIDELFYSYSEVLALPFNIAEVVHIC